MSRFRAIVQMSMFALFCAVGASAQEKKIEMIPVKYAGLKEEVLKHRGKVVVVDFWAGY